MCELCLGDSHFCITHVIIIVLSYYCFSSDMLEDSSESYNEKDFPWIFHVNGMEMAFVFSVLLKLNVHIMCVYLNGEDNCVMQFLKSAWRHSVYYYYDKARNTPYFASWHLGDSLGVYRWPQYRYKRRFYKSHSRLSKITTGNRCRNMMTMQNVTNRNLIDPNKSGTWG